MICSVSYWEKDLAVALSLLPTLRCAMWMYGCSSLKNGYCKVHKDKHTSATTVYCSSHCELVEAFQVICGLRLVALITMRASCELYNKLKV